MPMIVRLEEQQSTGLGSIVFMRRYYFWYVFGACRLPFQEQDPPGPTVGSTAPLQGTRFQVFGA